MGIAFDEFDTETNIVTSIHIPDEIVVDLMKDAPLDGQNNSIKIPPKHQRQLHLRKNVLLK